MQLCPARHLTSPASHPHSSQAAMSPQASIALLWFLCTLVPCLRAGQSRYCRSSDYYRPRGNCGHNLANILSVVCSDRGFVEPGRKRSDVIPVTDRADLENANSEELPENSPFLMKAKAMSLLRKRDSVLIGGVTYRRGVTCECCVHKCSFSEFEQYCLSTGKRSAPPSDAIYRFVNKPITM